jgi:hypothetical protein
VLDPTEHIFDSSGSDVGVDQVDGRLATKAAVRSAQPTTSLAFVTEYIERSRIRTRESNDAFGFRGREHSGRTPARHGSFRQCEDSSDLVCISVERRREAFDPRVGEAGLNGVMKVELGPHPGAEPQHVDRDAKRRDPEEAFDIRAGVRSGTGSAHATWHSTWCHLPQAF